MEWSDEGILLNTSPHGERSAILQVFTANKGRHSGIIKNAYSPKMRSVLQPSSQLYINWTSRLEEHLGSFKVDLVRPRADILIANRIGLAAFNALSALCISILAERDPMPEFYNVTEQFLDKIAVQKEWEFSYLDWELKLLSFIGFGLDLDKCVVTGTTENLCYISPKSGKAVCKDAGKKYHSKLLPFPSIFKSISFEGSFSYKDLVAGLNLTGFFIEKWLDYSIENKKTLAIRKRLIDTLSNEEYK